ncbi:MAG: 5-methylcytosine-specific restriction endonuclease system specificity protein McrC [Clostridiaceae bacterium]
MAKNINIKNIYYMLSYAYKSLSETGFDQIASEDFENIHDLFAAIIARGVAMQVKRGLHRDYIPVELSLSGVRGQIRISESIKQQTQSQGKLVCSFDEFTEDSLHNQVLKSTMLLLLRQGHVKSENKTALRKLLLYFSNVSQVEVTSIRWNSLKYHRNNASYQMLMGICYLTIKGLLLNTEFGTHKLATWLQDEEMFRLYERFVLFYYQKHHPEFSPRAAFVRWDLWDDSDTAYLPTMKTDITLCNGEKKLIIDTKYYGRTMHFSPLYNSTTFISQNIYQIFTYVKNSDQGSTGKVAGILLYAKTDESITPDQDFNMGGNRISLKTLDLNQDWTKITEQLENLCRWLTVV